MQVVSRIVGAVALCSLAILPGRAAHAATIYACAGKALGVLRIVSGPAACTSFENPISWNSEGPAGAQGPTGPQGPQGAQGPQGPAGVTAGINAAIFAEIVLDPDPAATDNCTVDFWRGADEATGTPTGNSDECILDFTMPAGQPQTWGTAYECFTSVPGGYGAPWGTTCHTQGGFNSSTGNSPQVYIQCLTGTGAALPTFTRVQLLCVN